MSATVGAALKKIATYLITDKKALKVVGTIILIILIVILMPIIALLGLFSGSIEIDTDSLHEMIAQQQSAAMTSWYDVENAMRSAGYDQLRIQEAQVLVTFALYDHASQRLLAKGIHTEILVPTHKDWNEDLLSPTETEEPICTLTM